MFERAFRKLRSDFLVLAITSFILNVLVMVSAFISYSDFSIINFFHIAFLAIVVIGFMTINNGGKNVGYIGIITAILLFFNLLFGANIDKFLGVIVLIHSIKYLKYYE